MWAGTEMWFLSPPEHSDRETLAVKQMLYNGVLKGSLHLPYHGKEKRCLRMKGEIKMPCPPVFISSGGIKDRKIRKRNRSPKKSNTLFFQIQSGCACTEGIWVKHSSARAAWRKSMMFCFLGKFRSVEARCRHRSGLTLPSFFPVVPFRDGHCSSRQTPPAISVLEVEDVRSVMA